MDITTMHSINMITNKSYSHTVNAVFELSVFLIFYSLENRYKNMAMDNKPAIIVTVVVSIRNINRFNVFIPIFSQKISS